MVIETFNSFSRKDIDSLRHQSGDLVEKVQGVISKIVQIRSKEDLHEVLLEYIPSKYQSILMGFFEKNPSAWADLMRKLNKHRRYNDRRKWHIDETDVGNIMEVLLVRGRKADIGPQLVAAIRNAILPNMKLIEYASKKPSILDSSGHSFSKIPEKNRPETIEKIVRTGLTNNIDDCNEDNLEKDYFLDVFRRLVIYLEKVFGKKVPPEIARCFTIKGLVKELQKMFKAGDSEDAWMIIQSFHAWARVKDIEQICEDATKEVAKIPRLLLANGIVVGDIAESTTTTGVKLYSSQITLKGKKYGIKWRVKTPESILQKMWQKSDYNNADAVRDIIGMNVVYPDSTSDEEKRELIHAFSGIMPNYGYLLKNKNEVQSIGYLQEGIKKEPIGIKEEKSSSSLDDFMNMSLSGFIRLGRDSFGCEVQFSTETAASEKSKEDPYYKIRGLLDAFMRGPKYRLPSEVYSILREKVNSPYLEGLKIQNLSELVWKMIEGGYLFAYYQLGKKGLMFTHKEHREAFGDAFPNAKIIEPGHYAYEGLRDYIFSPSRMVNNDDLTIPGISSRTQSLGLGKQAARIVLPVKTSSKKR